MEITLESGMCLRVEDTVQSGKRSVFGGRGKKEYLLEIPMEMPNGQIEKSGV